MNVFRVRWRVLLALSILFCSPSWAGDARKYDVVLHDVDDETAVSVATLVLEPAEQGYSYRLQMNEAVFGDHFLSMRPFKCIKANANMLCHLQYPYEIARSITNDDLTDLEYDLLFIRRKSTDYGINPWNGLYYRLTWEGDELHGVGHEVDLDILAVPPESGNTRPIKPVDLHEVQAGQLWLPRLVAKPQD